MFFVWPTPTVRQFAGDDVMLQKRWMAWVPLFFPLLFATAIAAITSLMAAVRYSFVRDRRSWAIILLLSCGSSTLAFFAVLSLAPTA
jgi:predicted membrane protein